MSLVLARPGLILPRGYQKPARPAVNRAHPLSKGLIGCWLLGDSADSRASDISGGGKHGTFNANTPLAQSHHGGLSNLFAPSSQYISTNFNFSNRSQGSISWWRNSSVAYNDTTWAYFDWGQSDSGDEFSCQKYTDNNWYVGWNGSGGDTRVTFAASSSNYTQGSWSNYIFDWDSTGSRFRQNGVQIASNGTAANVRPALTSTFNLGRQGNDFSGPSSAYLEGFRVYDRVLTTAEGFWLYAEPYAGIYDRRAVRYWVGGAAVVAPYLQKRRTTVITEDMLDGAEPFAPLIGEEVDYAA